MAKRADTKPQNDALEFCAVYGLPLKLKMDSGSANTSSALLNALKELDVDLIKAHGNAQAKGRVEKALLRVERDLQNA